jgi:hypothetical protein
LVVFVSWRVSEDREKAVSVKEGESEEGTKAEVRKQNAGFRTAEAESHHKDPEAQRGAGQRDG